MSAYLVKSRINRDGKDYEPGDTIELTKAQADQMPWAVELPPAPKAKGKDTKSEKGDES